MRKRSSAFLFCVIFVMQIFGISLLGIVASPKKANAQQAVSWISFNKIKYGDTIFTDAQPFDNTREFTSKTACSNNKIKVNESGKTATDIHIEFKDATGSCKENDYSDVSIANSERKKIGAQQIDSSSLKVLSSAHSVFPYGKDCKTGVTVVAGSSLSSLTDLTYRKEPSLSGGATNIYYLVRQDKTVSKECRIVVNTVNGERTMAIFSNNDRIPGDGLRVASTEEDKAIDDSDTTDNGDGAVQNDGDVCDAKLDSPLSWILCPVIDTIQLGVNRFYTAAEDALNFHIDDSNSPVKDVWINIRNIANILFVISFLIIIISQALIGKL